MSDDMWTLVRNERQALVDDLSSLTPEQWTQSSLCTDWTVRDKVHDRIGESERGQLLPGSHRVIWRRLHPKVSRHDLLLDRRQDRLASSSVIRRRGATAR
jgi:hypothetical protein